MARDGRERFATMLTGGHRNSLGRTEEVVAITLGDRDRLKELLACVAGQPDELVRMRASDALEKVCRAQPQWLLPYAERLIGEFGEIPQPSVMWHTAQMLGHLRHELTAAQRRRAVTLLKRYLTTSADWIVLTTTASVLTTWAEHDARVAAWLAPELHRLADDPRTAVAKRASRCLAALQAATESEPGRAARRAL